MRRPGLDSLFRRVFRLGRCPPEDGGEEQDQAMAPSLLAAVPLW
jgi:hypothetical protein